MQHFEVITNVCLMARMLLKVALYTGLGPGIAIVTLLEKLRGFCSCGRSAIVRCDWKISATGTCDAPICPQHAKQVGVGKHLCPVHYVHYGFWKRRHPGVVVPEQPSLFGGAA